MGIIGSKEMREQRKQNSVINRSLMASRRSQIKTQKLLLLGAAECGKSTILKQMRILHDSGFTQEEVDMQKGIVYQNAVQGMLTMINAREELGIIGTTLDKECHIEVVRKWMQSKMDREPFSFDVFTALKELWQDNSIQQCYERRNEFQLADCVKTFLDDLDRIGAKDYTPSDQDILYTRVPTNGVSEVRFIIKETTFRVFDVGGQRSERRKWIHCFDNVNAIIFLAAISEYDQVIVEDGKTNRIHEAMNLFKQICNSPVFAVKVSVILFLNKKDLFEEKLKTKSIKIAFPDYTGEETYEECVQYIQERFENQREEPMKKVYTHETCATDTTQVERVLDSVIDTILRNNVKTAGIT